MSHKDCELCEITHKVFGEEYPSCAAISNEMVKETLDMMQVKVKRLQEIADAKLRRGEITPEEHRLASENTKFSMAFAVSSLAASMTIDGPRIPPQQMMELIENKMKDVIMMVLMNRLGLSIEAPAPAPPARPKAAPDPRMN